MFKVAVHRMIEAALRVLEKAGMTQDDISVLVPHQANMRIINAIAKRLDLDRKQIIITLDQTGNTSAASIPITLDTAVKDGRIRSGDIVLCISFGAGFTWGGMLLRW